MAVTFDAVGPSSTGYINTTPTNTTATVTWSHTVGASATALLVWAVFDNDTLSSISCTAGGTSMGTGTLVSNSGGGTGQGYFFKLASPPTGSITIAVTYATNVHSLDCITGGSQSFIGGSSFGTPVTVADHVGASLTLTATGVASTSMVAAFAAFGDDPTGTLTTGTSRYYALGTGNGGSDSGNSAAGTNTGTGSVSVTWSGLPSGDTNAGVAIEVQAGGGGGGPAPAPLAAALAGKTWRRRFDHRQHLPLQPPPNVTALAGLATGTGTAQTPQFGVYITGITTDSTVGGWFHDNNGKPRLAMFDNPWALVFNSGQWNGTGGGTYQQDMASYLASRSAQGFTGAYLSALGNLDNGGSFQDGRTWDGVYPFTANGTAGPITSGSQTLALNNTYWQRVDYLISQAATVGITIFLNIAYTANASHGNLDAGGPLDASVLSSTQYAAYGTALVSRYGSSPNLVWIYGNDYFAGAYDTQFGQIRSAIVAAGDTHAMAVHVYPESTSRYDIQTSTGGTSGSTFSSSNSQVNWTYSYNVLYWGIELAYGEASAHSISQLPAIWGDGYFYDAGVSIPTDQMMRQMAWWALSSGARGMNNGSNDIQFWGSGSPAAVTTGLWYTQEAGVARLLIESLTNWQKLMPDTGSVLVTAGRGTHASGITSGSNYTGGTDNYVSASRVSDGSLAVIYGAKAFSITIDQTKMVSGYTATWVDPVTGATTSATTGSTYSSSGLGNNSAGEPDWVLILQAPATTTANAGLATGTGAALQPVVAITVKAGLATGTGAALQPVPAITANAQLPTGTGAALAPVPVITVPAGLANGTGAALQPTVSTSGNTTANAGLATGTGAALAPIPVVMPNAGLAAGTGTAPQPSEAITASAGLATGTGAALSPVPAVTVLAGLATGTGAALQPTVQTSGNTTANAGLATGTGAALSPAVTIVTSSTLATGTGAAQAPAATLSVPASLATGTGAAPSPTPVVTVLAGLPTGTGAALQPSVSTSGNTTANAQLATGTGTAQAPVAMVTAFAGLATGTGTALNGQRIIPATLATGTGTAQTPVLTVIAQAQAAQALAQAFAGTVPAQHIPAKSVSSVTDPRDGTASVTAAATSTSSVS